ncbi:Rubredoxin-NAD(+) reductase [BD1-7 clade bacterium]|uniref:Rubredoxin-NAD(+) reductase n=1 Tax=BD1-7 clade bacterium TaxID=2029982 RepID=A0A5S9QFS8_9GAMM|nr:Rubredoxin-NAD(+) reductase [BD1-7 clade bacterium]
MAQWECIVCGWVYDEAKGDPDNGVAPGTKWDDVPESWLCPDCCVGKEDFELLEGSESSPAEEAAEEEHKDDKPIVIIGSGLAGYNLVKEFRKADKETPVIIITSDDGRNYSKPMLSTGFTKGQDADALAMSDAGSMAKQFHCSVWTMTRVTNIDTAKQTITVGGATHIDYSKLVIAWGAEVIRPAMEGDALDQVYSINDLMDYAEFRTAIKKQDVKKVAIIGGGLIGSEFTNDLINGEFETETVDPMGYCLPTLLPEQAGKSVQNALEAKGAKFHFGPLENGDFGPVATAVNKSDNGVVVSLNNGKTIEADVVVSAVGVRPRIELAQAAGIECNRGVVANRFLETSAKNVYTLGDCAEINGHVLFYVAPLMAGARALAKTLAGAPTEVSYPAMPVTIKTPACPVVVSPAPRGAEGEWNIEQDGNNVVAEFRNAAGELLGFALTGEGTKQKMRLQKELPAIMA